MSSKRRSKAERPLLKPYTGVGWNWLQRNSSVIIAVAAAALAVPYGFYYALTTPWLLVPFLVPIAVLVMIVIWALPEVDRVPERTMEVMVFGCFVTLGLWPSYLAVDFPGLPWITLIRLIATPLTLLLLVSLSISPQFRSRFAEVLEHTPLLWRFMVLFVLAQIISIPFSKNLGDSFSRFFIHQTNETVLFFMCAYAFRKPGRAEHWAALFWIFAVATSFIGLLEFRQQKVLWVSHIPSFFVMDETVSKILTGGMRFTTGQYRSQSVFSTSLGFSEFLAFALPFVIHFAASNHYKPVVRTAAWASIPLILIAVIATDSRLGILGFFLSSMFYLFFWALRLWRREKHNLIAPTILFSYPVLFILLVISSFTVGRIKAKVWGMGQYDNSNQARVDQFHMGIPKIISHPFGHGPGQAGFVLGYTNPGGTLTIDLGWMVTALDYGILGFILGYGIFVVSIFYALKFILLRENDNTELSLVFPLCISLFNFIIIKMIFAQEENHPIVYMMVGIVAGLVYQARSVAPHQRLAPSRPTDAPTRGAASWGPTPNLSANGISER